MIGYIGIHSLKTPIRIEANGMGIARALRAGRLMRFLRPPAWNLLELGQEDPFKGHYGFCSRIPLKGHFGFYNRIPIKGTMGSITK